MPIVYNKSQIGHLTLSANRDFLAVYSKWMCLIKPISSFTVNCFCLHQMSVFFVMNIQSSPYADSISLCSEGSALWFVFIIGLVIVSMNCFTCKFEEFCISLVVIMVTRPCTRLCVCIVFRL